MTESVAWVKWHFDKWLTDPGLRKCSLAARGLWMDLLCIMHNATPYGHLVVNMKPLSDRDVVQFVGTSSLKEVKMLMRSLRDAGVFSETSEGVIYSRRLIRDNELREKSRVYGKAGGNPALKNPRGTGNPPLNPISENPLKTEIEREKEKEKSSLRSPARSKQGTDRLVIAMEVWNQICVPPCDGIEGPSKARQRTFSSRLRDELHDDIDQWRALCERIRASNFLTGGGSRGWIIKFDWVIKSENMRKVMAGEFDDKPRNVNGRPADSRLQASELILGRRLPGREHLGEPAGDWTSTIEGELFNEP